MGAGITVYPKMRVRFSLSSAHLLELKKLGMSAHSTVPNLSKLSQWPSGREHHGHCLRGEGKIILEDEKIREKVTLSEMLTNL